MHKGHERAVKDARFHPGPRVAALHLGLLSDHELKASGSAGLPDPRPLGRGCRVERLGTLVARALARLVGAAGVGAGIVLPESPLVRGALWRLPGSPLSYIVPCRAAGSATSRWRDRPMRLAVHGDADAGWALGFRDAYRLTAVYNRLRPWIRPRDIGERPAHFASAV